MIGPGSGKILHLLFCPDPHRFHIQGGIIMTVLTDVRGPSLQPAVAGRSRSLIEWVSCNNPFYAISALLVCLGLWVSFGGQAQAAQTWALIADFRGN